MTNLDRWNACKLNKQAQFDKVAQKLIANKARYQAVEKTTGVPWWFIAAIHYREANCNFNTQLGQGDPLNKVSVHVPKGRGPFKTWEDGAYDALVNTAPKAASNKDWSIGNALDLLEKYNGLGYKRKGLSSPYLWAGTNQYTSGKYVSDGVYNPSVVDNQLGCAGILKAMNITNTTAHQIGIGGAAAGTVVAASQYPEYMGAIIIIGFIVVAIIGYLGLKKLKGN